MTADGVLGGITYDPRTSREDEQARQARSDRLAVSLLRRNIVRHDPQCKAGTCRHRNHGRDVHHLMMMMDILGLAEVSPATPDDYENKHGLAWHSVTREEMSLMQPVKAA